MGAGLQGLTEAPWLDLDTPAATGQFSSGQFNGGQFNSDTSHGVAYELLNETSMAMLRAVAGDTVDTFVTAHPDWVAGS